MTASSLSLPARPRALRQVSVSRPLAVLLVVALVEALAWVTVMPPFQGPDEAAHFDYTQNLAENGQKPQFDKGSGTDSTEVGSALTYLNLRALAGSPNARPPSAPIDIKGWAAVEKGLKPGSKKNAGGPNAVAKNPPLYYAYEAIPYKVFADSPLLTRMFVMRLANALLFVLTVLFTWLLASEIFARIWPRVLATSLVLLQPLLVFMASVINPDTMQACLWTAFLWLAVRMLNRGPTAGRMATMLAVALAALFTHGRGFALLPVALIACLLIAHRHRPRWRKPLLWSLAALVPLGIAWGAYRATHGGLQGAYGGELNIPPEARHPFQFLEFVWQFYLPKLPFMSHAIGPNYGFRQLWIEQFAVGRFGALDTSFSPGTYDLGAILIMCAVLAFVVLLVVRRDLLAARWDVVLLLAFTVASLMLFLHFASYRTIATQPTLGDPLIVGRYLLPLVSIYALGFTYIAASIRRWGPVVAGVMIGAALALQLGSLGLVLARFYG